MILKNKINIFSQLKPGDHVCSFYGAEQEHADLTVQFLQQALESADNILYLGDLLNRDSLRTYCSQKGVSIEEHLASEKLIILNSDQSFRKNGSFDPDQFLSSFKAQAETLLARGITNVWISGETSWLNREITESYKFTVFESKLNNFLQKHSCTVLCQYKINAVNPDLLIHALHTHPLVIIGDSVYPNIYYMPPDKFFSSNKYSESLNYLLNSIMYNKKSADLLVEKSEESKSLFSNIAIPLFRTDIKTGRIINCNESLAAFLNFKDPDELIQKKLRLADYYDEHIRAVLLEHMHKNNGKISNCEIPITKPDGTIGFVQVTGRIYPEKGYLEGSFIDITDLKLSELRNKTILKSAMDGFYIFDHTGTIIEANDAFCRMTDFSQENICGMNIHNFDLKMPENNILKLCGIIKKTGSVHFETRYRKKGGTYIDAEITINHVHINKDLFFSFVRDITARIQNEKKLLLRKRKLEERIKELQCLFNIADLVEKYGSDIESILEHVVQTIPQAMQYPGITGARLITNDTEYTSANFVKTAHIMVSYIHIFGRRSGMLEICLQLQKEHDIQKSFLKEERRLLDHIAQRIGRIIERVQTEKELKKYRHQLEEIVQKRTEKLKNEIIERKKTEEALTKSEQMYRAVVEDQTEFINRTSPEGRLTFVNKSLCKYVNMSPEQLIGEDYIQMLPKDARLIVKDCLNSLTVKKPVKTIEHRHITKNGKEHWLEWTNRKLFDSRGNTIEFQSVGRDVTERKLSEDALLKEKKMIREYLDVANAIFVVINRDQKISLINKKGAEMLGYSSYKDLVGKNWFNTCIPKKDRKRVKHVFTSLISPHTKPSDLSAFEYFENTILTKTGGERIIAWHNTILTDEHGRIKSTLSSGQDITDKILLEKEKEKYRSQLFLSDKMSSIASLASGIAHELNQVYNEITRQIEFCQTTHDKLKQRNALNAIFDNCTLVSKITKNLLKFTDHKNTSKEKCDIAQLIDPILSLTETHLKKHNIIVKRKYKGPLHAKLNKQKIQQVLLNIIFNARDAMIPDGGTLTISSTIKNNLVTVQIQDTGKGIPQQIMKQICDPFFTTKSISNENKAHNIGLGLSIAYGIISNHNGNIHIESKLGAGTTVTISLPRNIQK
ncbi:MAG: PAS domain S-box protein [bacterium]